MEHLIGGQPGRSFGEGIACVALAHNERHILPEFLDHYRRLGPVRFLIVDDRSTDGTAQYLAEQPDVAVFNPKEGSTYRAHKAEWRRSLLDRYAEGRWCLSLDIDEHLRFRDAARLGLTGLLSKMSSEGAEFMHCIMLDMYGNRPLRDHHYEGSGLLEEFPYFDGPETYRFRYVSRRHGERYATPRLLVEGSVRERMFFDRFDQASPLQMFLKRRFLALNTPEGPTSFVKRWGARAARLATRKLWADPPFVSSKVALLRWRRGMRFSGGAHSVNEHLKPYREFGLLLHYKFTRGAAGIDYVAARGQHASGAHWYKLIASSEEAMARVPVTTASRRYEGESSFDEYYSANAPK